eukprot:4782409-Alexandrium_andersonii.AAC.1
MYEELLTAKPPGASDLLPDWALSQARDSSKQAYQQAARVRGAASGGKAGKASHDSEGEEDGGACLLYTSDAADDM